MNREDILRKARYLLWKCRSEGVEPLGWCVNTELWDTLSDIPRYLWGKQEDNTANTLYGLPVEVSDVYTDLSIRII